MPLIAFNLADIEGGIYANHLVLRGVGHARIRISPFAVSQFRRFYGRSIGRQRLSSCETPPSTRANKRARKTPDALYIPDSVRKRDLDLTYISALPILRYDCR